MVCENVVIPINSYMTNEKKPKKPTIDFYCEVCTFNCSNKKDYTRHLLTAKHKLRSNANKKPPTHAKNYECICGRHYNHASSLWNHKQKCKLFTTSEINQDKTEEVIPNNKDVMIEKLVEELTSERAEKNEMKSMFMLMMEKYQEIQVQNQENPKS